MKSGCFSAIEGVKVGFKFMCKVVMFAMLIGLTIWTVITVYHGYNQQHYL